MCFCGGGGKKLYTHYAAGGEWDVEEVIGDLGEHQSDSAWWSWFSPLTVVRKRHYPAKLKLLYLRTKPWRCTGRHGRKAPTFRLSALLELSCQLHAAAVSSRRKDRQYTMYNGSHVDVEQTRSALVAAGYRTPDVHYTVCNFMHWIEFWNIPNLLAAQRAEYVGM
jgi:hypothetical protein